MPSPFSLRYLLASCMYGTLPLTEIVPEVGKIGATHIDIWPQKHGDQREQVEAMGRAAFADLLNQHGVGLGASTRFDLGPFGLREEMHFARSLDAQLLVCGSKGPKGLEGDVLRAAVKEFVEQLRPHLAITEETGVRLAIENHSSALIESPDSIKWLAEFAPSPQLGIALAPYHLPNDAGLIAALVRALGNEHLFLFYGWQHGVGCTEKRPKAEELLQMPGRGDLDFVPIVAALKEIDYAHWTEIFMHPVPRGIPILSTAAQVTAEINRARAYLEDCLEQV